jgi:hypothetical protein
VDIRTARSGGGATSAISETTHSTLTFLENVPAYEKTIEGVLSRSQSERSWLMGAKDPPCPARNAAEEGGIVNLYVGKSDHTDLFRSQTLTHRSRCSGYTASLLRWAGSTDEAPHRTGLPVKQL